MICTKCNEDKPDEQFSWAIKDQRRRRNCKACHKVLTGNHYQNHKDKYRERDRSHDQKYRDDKRRRVLAYLRQHPCVDCGIADLRVLTFDHVRGTKKMDISKMANCKYSWSTIEQEIAKCDVRCFNCHAVRTAEQFGYRFDL